jgi:aminopeptidase YwaD
MIAPAILDRAWSAVEALSSDIGPRVAGTSGEAVAAELIAVELEKRGLAPRFERFSFVGWEPEAAPFVEIKVDDGEWMPIATAPMAYTGSTSPTGVTGRLERSGFCELVPGLLEWPRYAVMNDDGLPLGFVAVVPDGRVRPFPRPERQLLQEPIAIVGSDEFAPYEREIGEGRRVDAKLRTRGRYVPDTRSLNVIAEIAGTEDGVIVVSGHFDTVAGTSGAGDNASGIGGCLALAEHFSGEKPAKTIRFIAWGAHEFGLLGSQFHVQSLAQQRRLANVEAAIALDILSDGDRLGVWVGGDTLLTELGSVAAGSATAFPVEFFPRGRGETDSWSFAERGIDSVMLLTLPYEHFHLSTDTIENNNRALFDDSVRIAERIVRHLVERRS